MIKPQFDNDEHGREIYEDLPWYPKPPLINFPEFDRLISSGDSGVHYGRIPSWFIKAWWTAIGLKSFYKQLPPRLEKFLREGEVNGPMNGLLHVVTFTLKDDPDNSNPFDRAVSLLLAMYELYEDITSGTFEPDQYEGQVLEMGHYLNLFATNFVVDGGKPQLFKSKHNSHITAIVDGKFFSLSVGGEGSKTEFKQLKRALLGVVEKARQKGASDLHSSPGLLTCADEMAQTRIFTKLQENEVNARSLRALRHSFVTLCLDLDSCPQSETETAVAAHSLNCGNRWYHASFQIVVFGNGKACILSHPGAYIPGDTATRAAHEIQIRALKYHEENEVARKLIALPQAQELEWEIDQEFITQARKDMESILDKQPASFELLGFGKNYFDAYGLPSVPAFVLALQMTIKRLTGKMSVIMQFLTTSKYRCMSFTVADVTTQEVREFVDFMDGEDAPLDRAVVLLRRAINSQIQECRKVRSYIPFPLVFDLFMRSSRTSNKVLRRLKAFIVERIIGIAYLAGLFRFTPRDVLISHPRIYPDLAVVGRPGIRVPYAEDFALHYQIHDDKIATTIMPSLKWTIPNADLVAALEESLRQIQTITGHAQQAPTTDASAWKAIASQIR